jgi:hypothetical protein
VTFLEEHVGDLVVARVDDQPPDDSDLAVGGIDLLTSSYRHFVEGKSVVGNGLGDVPDDPPQTKVGLRERLSRGVVRMATAPRQELGLFGVIELLEPFDRATEPDLTTGGVVNKVEGNETTETLPVLGFHHQMGDGPSHGVHHNPGHFAANTIGTTCFGPDGELCWMCHGHLLLTLPNLGVDLCQRQGRF